MKKQVVRAGKYFSVGILFIACLPVLLPLLFLLSIFGFTFVLPLGCALAGFLYLRKYVGMLYRKLPSTLVGCSSWGRRRPLPGPHTAPPLSIDLPLRDQQEIETSESVDPEFDAVVISTSQEKERGSVGGADGTGIESEPEALSSADVSAGDGTGREGVDADNFDQDGITVREKDYETIVDNWTNREGTDDETAEKDTRREGGDDESDAVVISTPPREEERWSVGGAGGTGIESEPEAVSSADVSAEDGTEREGVDADKFDQDGSTVLEKGDETIVDNATNREGTDDDDTAEKDTREEGSDDVFTENGTRPEEAGEVISAENWTMKEGVHVPTFAENGTTREETHDDTSPETVTGREIGEYDVSTKDGTKKEGIAGDTPDDDINRSPVIADDTSLDETRGHVTELDIFGKDGTGSKWQDSTSIEDGTKKEEGYNDGETQEEVEAEQENEIENLNEEKMENTMLSPANNEKSFESPEDFGRTSGIEQIGERSEQDEVHAKPDGGTHPEVNDEDEGSEGVETPSEETKEQKFEAVPDERILGGLGDDRNGKSATAVIPPHSFHEASENESPTKPEGVRQLLPNQAHEDDIWICKECGWKYPNAKPSAKIRRNHKKHCLGSSPGAPAPEGEIDADVTGPGNEHHSQENLGTGGTAISSADSGEHDEQLGVANELPSVTSESFRSVPEEFPHDMWSSFDSVDSNYDDEQDQLTQVQQELRLTDDLNAVKGVVGDKHVSTGPLLTDIEELSQFLGIDLPVRSADLPDIEWAKLSIEVMKVVVGID